MLDYLRTKGLLRDHRLDHNLAVILASWPSSAWVAHAGACRGCKHLGLLREHHVSLRTGPRTFLLPSTLSILLLVRSGERAPTLAPWVREGTVRWWHWPAGLCSFHHMLSMAHRHLIPGHLLGLALQLVLLPGAEALPKESMIDGAIQRSKGGVEALLPSISASSWAAVLVGGAAAPGASSCRQVGSQARRAATTSSRPCSLALARL